MLEENKVKWITTRTWIFQQFLFQDQRILFFIFAWIDATKISIIWMKRVNKLTSKNSFAYRCFGFFIGLRTNVRAPVVQTVVYRAHKIIHMNVNAPANCQCDVFQLINMLFPGLCLCICVLFTSEEHLIRQNNGLLRRMRVCLWVHIFEAIVNVTISPSK